MTTYKVANPRGIPAGRRIVSVRRLNAKGDMEETSWHEGDTITEADAFSAAGWKRWIAEGFVVKDVSNGS